MTPARLAPRLQLASDSAAVSDAIARASARFIDAIGYNPLAAELPEVASLDGNGISVLLLPGAPVRSVTLVELDGAAITDWQLSRRLGMLHRRAGWPWGFGNIEVTYAYGWPAAELPEAIADAVLEQAEAIHRLRPGIQSSTLGPQAVRFESGVTQAWTETVARYQRARVSAA